MDDGDRIVVAILGNLTMGMETLVNLLPGPAVEKVILFTIPGDLMKEEAEELERIKVQMNLIQSHTEFVCTKSLAVSLRDSDVVIIGHTFPIMKSSLLAMKRFLKSVAAELQKIDEDDRPRFVFCDEIRGIVYGSLFVKLLLKEKISDSVEVLAISLTVYVGTKVFGVNKEDAALWPTLNEDVVIQEGKNDDKFKKDLIGASEGTNRILEGRALAMAMKLMSVEKAEESASALDRLRIVGRQPTDQEARELDIGQGGISYLPVPQDEVPVDGSIRLAIKGIYDYTKEALSMINM